MNTVRKKLGNYRLMSNITGIANSEKILKDFTCEKKALLECKKLIKSNIGEFNYFIQEEVIYYPSSFKDKNGNPIQSAPLWVRHEDFT